MKTHSLFLSLAAAASLCLPLAAQEAGRHLPAGMQALIPNDSSALLLIAPLDDVEDAVQSLLEVTLPEMGMMANLDTLIAQVNGEFPFDLNLIDRSKPIAIAFGPMDPMSGAEPPFFVLIPSLDPTALQAAIPMPNIMEASLISGSYLALCEKSYPSALGASKIASLLPSGLIAATFDARPMVKAYGPMAGFFTSMGLGQVKTEINADSEMPPAFREMAMEVLNATPKTVTGIIDSLGGLQLSIDLDGTLLSVDSSLMLMDGSLLSGMHESEGATFNQLSHLIDLSAPGSFGFGADLGGMARWIRPYVDQIMDTIPVPEEAPEGVDLGPFQSPAHAFKAIRELTDNGLGALSYFGSGMVSSVSFVNNKPVTTFWLHGVNAESLTSNLALVFQTELAGMAGLILEANKVGEATTELSVKLDPSTLGRNFALGEGAVNEIRGGFNQAFGDSIKLTLTDVGTDTLVLYNGDKETLLAALVAAKNATRGTSPDIARLGKSLGTASPFSFMRLELGQLAREIVPIIEQFEGPLPFPKELLADIAMPLTLHRGMSSSSWFGGLSLDLKDAGKLVQIAMRARATESSEPAPASTSPR